MTDYPPWGYPPEWVERGSDAIVDHNTLSGHDIDGSVTAVLAAVAPLIRAATFREAADRLDALPETYKIPGDHETWTPYHEGFDDGRDRAAIELRRWAEEG